MLLLLFLFFKSSYADETLQRVDAMLADIETLRQECRAEISKEKERRVSLQQENLFYKKKIELLKKEIAKKCLVKKKDKNETLCKQKEQNPFPKLLLRE